MTARLYVDQALSANTSLALPPEAARHVQVLRMQPGNALILFNGEGGEWQASVEQIGRRDVQVMVGEHVSVDRELPQRITLAVGMPANERMDALIEKATELGAACVQPLLTERSVLRLSGERAEKRVAHWQGIAIAACEQSGRTKVPRIEPVLTLAAWIAALPAAPSEQTRIVLSPRATAGLPASTGEALLLSGPEGGLSASEEALAMQHGFSAAHLGPRVLRADTAPLAALARWSFGG